MDKKYKEPSVSVINKADILFGNDNKMTERVITKACADRFNNLCKMSYHSSNFSFLSEGDSVTFSVALIEEFIDDLYSKSAFMNSSFMLFEKSKNQWDELDKQWKKAYREASSKIIQTLEDGNSCERLKLKNKWLIVDGEDIFMSSEFFNKVSELCYSFSKTIDKEYFLIKDDLNPVSIDTILIVQEMLRGLKDSFIDEYDSFNGCLQSAELLLEDVLKES